jgi:ABC-type multidrug transport system fused ATPase/permease subunit
MYGLITALQYILIGLIFYFGTVYISAYNVDKGGALSALYLIFFAVISAGSSSSYVRGFAEIKLAVRNMFKFIDLEDELEIREKSGSKLLKVPIKGNIRFEHVSFKYPSKNSLALDAFTASIGKGDSVGVLGSSGSGKSTIFSLLLGMYSPSKGHIYIEDIDI